MIICGVVITLKRSEPSDELACFSGLTLGQARGCRVPAMLETPDDEALEQALSELESLAAVAHLDLAYVQTDDKECA